MHYFSFGEDRRILCELVDSGYINFELITNCLAALLSFAKPIPSHSRTRRAVPLRCSFDSRSRSCYEPELATELEPGLALVLVPVGASSCVHDPPSDFATASDIVLVVVPAFVAELGLELGLALELGPALAPVFAPDFGSAIAPELAPVLGPAPDSVFASALEPEPGPEAECAAHSERVSGNEIGGGQ